MPILRDRYSKCPRKYSATISNQEGEKQLIQEAEMQGSVATYLGRFRTKNQILSLGSQKLEQPVVIK